MDRIDHNIQNVAATVEEGLKQLQKVLSFPFLIEAYKFVHAEYIIETLYLFIYFFSHLC